MAFSTTGGASTAGFDLGATGTGTDLTVLVETGMGAGLAEARGLETGREAAFAAGLAEGADAAFTAGFLTGATGLTPGFGTALAAGLLAFTTGALATGLCAGVETALAGTTFLATGFTAALANGLATGLPGAAALPAGLADTCTLALVTAALLSFPVLAFTSCLLAERSCAWSVGLFVPLWPLDGFFDGGSSARECTGFAIGKPISCKIETIIWPSIQKKHFKNPGYPVCRSMVSARWFYTNDCSMPCSRMSFGKSMPIKTILLPRASPSAHCGPKSLPINWCTP